MKKNLFLVSSIVCLFFLSNSAFAVFSVSLTPSNHNGYSISCFGGVDGAINITVSGGTSPYTYRWSTGATTQNVSALAAGYYQVTVTDNNSATCTGNVTLTQPTAMTLSVTPSIYSPQTTNISCYNCCNGYINISVGGGVTAYSYSWSSGQTTANIINLCKNTYTIIVTDANGCSKGEHQVMTEPDKNTWAMTGDSGSSASTNFIGTIDSVDLVYKTKNQERMRLSAIGVLSINSLASDSGGMVYTDATGKLFSTSNMALCNQTTPPGWWTLSNPKKTVYTCPNTAVAIGTTTVPTGIKFVIEGNTEFTTGSVGIGLAAQSGYKLCVDGKIGVREVFVTAAGSWPDYVFSNDYKLQSLDEINNFLKENCHLPGIPSACEIEDNGQPLGKIQNLQQQKIEELYLYIIKLQKQVDDLQKQLNK